MKSASLVKSYEYTAAVIRRQVAEIGARESTIQPYAGSHSINWLLGHIVSSRSFPLKLAGQAPVWGEDARARYRDGSEAIGAASEGVLPLDELSALLDASQSRLIAGLSAMSGEQLTMPAGYGDNSVFESFLYFHFHESYHVGQMTVIAELLGKRAKYLASCC